MTLADDLTRLARLVPGVAGYQDRERSRDIDKTVRERLAAELVTLQRGLEPAKRTLVDGHDLEPLPSLDGLAAKLDKLARTVEYAARGYRGVFDSVTVDQGALERLVGFDLGLFDGVATLRTHVERVTAAVADRARLAAAVHEMDGALDRFEQTFARRQRVLSGERD